MVMTTAPLMITPATATASTSAVTSDPILTTGDIIDNHDADDEQHTVGTRSIATGNVNGNDDAIDKDNDTTNKGIKPYTGPETSSPTKVPWFTWRSSPPNNTNNDQNINNLSGNSNLKNPDIKDEVKIDNQIESAAGSSSIVPVNNEGYLKRGLSYIYRRNLTSGDNNNNMANNIGNSTNNKNDVGSTNDEMKEPINPNSLTNVLIPPHAYDEYLKEYKNWKEKMELLNNPKIEETVTKKDQKTEDNNNNDNNNKVNEPEVAVRITHKKDIPRGNYDDSGDIREGIHTNAEDTEVFFQEPNILVPSIDILPVDNTWKSITTSITNELKKINSGTQTIVKPKVLSRRDPNNLFFEITNGGQRSIKILIIGVHGFFPTKMLRKFLGNPTGTSTKFINEAEATIKNYFSDKKDYKIEISKIALEREGRVFDRVDYFYDIMKNYEKEMNEFDYIYFASHSQGCPVTFMLLSRLLNDKLLKLETVNYYENEDIDENDGYKYTKKIISVLCMNGINNGPFYGADQTLLVRSLRTIEHDHFMELFEFQNFESKHSIELLKSLKICYLNGIKVTYVGTINDQLVPLYSSMSLFIGHPNIFRATFIDKKTETPNFLKTLINDGTQLINLGINDRMLIKEISSSLEGTLMGGGHSTAYQERQVYELAIKFSLETNILKKNEEIKYKPYKLETNPFRLPWCMRSLLYDIEKNLGQSETIKLHKEYNEWHPISKQQQQLKYRLTGLKSFL